MKLICVHWEDACELDDSPWGWMPDDFVYEPTMCIQVGFLLYDGPEGIVISNGVMKDGTVARRNQIPRGMIRSIEWLTEPSFLMEAESE